MKYENDGKYVPERCGECPWWDERRGQRGVGDCGNDRSVRIASSYSDRPPERCPERYGHRLAVLNGVG